jgi:hypothetical protein
LSLSLPQDGTIRRPGNSAGGRVIRHIRVIHRNVFTEEERKGLLADDPWMDRFPLGAEFRDLNGPDKLDVIGWANWIHIKTRRERHRGRTALPFRRP